MSGMENAGRYIAPRGLFHKLKQAEQNLCPVYFAGSTGVGKNAAVEAYLKKRAYLVLHGVASSGSLAEMPPLAGIRRSVVVVDRIDVLRDEESYAYIQRLLSCGRWILLLGRNKLPPWLKIARLSQPLLVLEEKDFFLGPRETQKLMKSRGFAADMAFCRKALEKSQGHPLYLLLLADRLCAGWALEESTDRAVREEIFYHLERQVTPEWAPEICNTLVPMGLFPVFTLELAQAVSQNADVRLQLERVAEQSGMLQKEEEGYRLRPITAEYFVWKLNREYKAAQIEAFYDRAGCYYERRGEWMRALECFEKSHNQGRISAVIVDNFKRHPGVGHYLEMRRYYLALTEKEIQKSALLTSGISMLNAMMLRIEESNRWYEELRRWAKRCRPGSPERKELDSQVAYLDIALPQRGTQHLAEALVRYGLALRNQSITLPEMNVTSNLPSLMNGGKDFCEWSKRDRELARTIGKVVELVLGGYGVGLVDIAVAESQYEKGGDLKEIATLLNQGRFIAENSGKIELCFVAVGLYTRLHALRGKIAASKDLLQSFTKKVKHENANFLLPNIGAMECRLALLEGDTHSVAAWYAQAPDPEVEFHTIERYVYLTRVRVCLALQRTEEALQILHRMEYLASLYHRIYIGIECLILRAICLYRLQDAAWRQALDEAVKKGEEYSFVRIFSEEGEALLPLLEKLYKAHARTQQRIFFKRILDDTRQMAVFYPAYLKPKIMGPELSDAELRVLRLLCEGLTAPAIAEKVLVSQSTVRFHCKNIYRKLNAAGKAEAVGIAKEMGLI